MFKLLNLLSTQEGRRVLLWLIVIGILIAAGSIIYESLNPSPEYTRPPGRIVTTVCSTGGNDCDENGFVKLWDDTYKTNSTFVRSPQAPFCVATETISFSGQIFWWIDCGLWQGNQLPIIEGWVPEDNLIFTGETFP